MIRTREEGEELIVPHFRSRTFFYLNLSDEEHHLNTAFQQMQNALEEFIHRGSDWRVYVVIGLEVSMVPYIPLSAGKYTTLPKQIQHLKGIVNMQNDDEKCFLWCILAALHPKGKNPQRIQQYYPYENDLNLNGITFPTPISKIQKFEKQNNISINVFGYENDFFPLYISELESANANVDLLYVEQDGNSHYCLIKDLNGVLRSTKRAKRKHYFCQRCLHGFIREDLLKDHLPYCKQFSCQKVEYPVEGKDNILKFENFYKKLRVPFVIYCDFETVVQKIDTCVPDPQTSSATHEAYFNPCGYANQVVCTNPNYTKPPVVHRGKSGENVVKHFLENLLQEENNIKDILGDPEPLIMNTETEKEFQMATHCHICEQAFTYKTKKVRDHCHVGVEGDANFSNYSNFRGL